jgi:hypothetical protein
VGFVIFSTAVIAASADLPIGPVNVQDVSTIEGIIAASYEALSGPPGERRDWARYRSLCDPDVRLVSASGDSKTGKTKIIRWNLQKYIHDVDGYLVGTGFEDKKLACVAIAPQGRVTEKMVSNIQEVRARGGEIFSIATKGQRLIEPVSDHLFEIPPCPELFSPLLTVLPLQLLAYFVATELGRDVDQPRNLAKSVTVE